SHGRQTRCHFAGERYIIESNYRDIAGNAPTGMLDCLHRTDSQFIARRKDRCRCLVELEKRVGREICVAGAPRRADDELRVWGDAMILQCAQTRLESPLSRGVAEIAVNMGDAGMPLGQEVLDRQPRAGTTVVRPGRKSESGVS